MSSNVGKSFLIYLLCLAGALLYARNLDAFSSGFSGADESSHFINSVFFYHFFQDIPLSDPISYAQEFYISYPKFSIGHWPPVYYILISLIFFLIPPTPDSAMIINIVVVVLPVFLISFVTLRFATWPLAVLAGALYTITPLVIDATAFFMTDAPLAFMCFSAALVWEKYANAKSRRVQWAALYGCLTAMAIMTKGNGWLLAFFPIFHILLSRQWSLFLALPTYIGAIFALMLTVPWYWITTKISSDGFNYSFGIDYSLNALLFNLKTLAINLTVPGFVISIVGVILVLTKSSANARLHRLTITMVSLVLATLTLQSLIPVDIVNRYAFPALPAMVILLIMSICMAGIILQSWFQLRPKAVGCFLALCAIILIFPNMVHLSRQDPQIDFRLNDAALLLYEKSKADVVVADGSSGAEGAFIAEALSMNYDRKSFIIRSSKLFSESDFMGRNYKIIESTTESIGRTLIELGVDAIVMTQFKKGEGYPHSDLLFEYLTSEDSEYHISAILVNRNRLGKTFVFESNAEIPPNVVGIRSINFPQKAPTLQTK